MARFNLGGEQSWWRLGEASSVFLVLQKLHHLFGIWGASFSVFQNPTFSADDCSTCGRLQVFVWFLWCCKLRVPYRVQTGKTSWSCIYSSWQKATNDPWNDSGQGSMKLHSSTSLQTQTLKTSHQHEVTPAKAQQTFRWWCLASTCNFFQALSRFCPSIALWASKLYLLHGPPRAIKKNTWSTTKPTREGEYPIPRALTSTSTFDAWDLHWNWAFLHSMYAIYAYIDPPKPPQCRYICQSGVGLVQASVWSILGTAHVRCLAVRACGSKSTSTTSPFVRPNSPWPWKTGAEVDRTQKRRMERLHVELSSFRNPMLFMFTSNDFLWLWVLCAHNIYKIGNSW